MSRNDSYQAVFESCFEAFQAMLSTEDYPITHKNLLFGPEDWRMDGTVSYLRSLLAEEAFFSVGVCVNNPLSCSIERVRVCGVFMCVCVPVCIRVSSILCLVRVKRKIILGMCVCHRFSCLVYFH